jgi:hypothetical protein
VCLSPAVTPGPLLVGKKVFRPEPYHSPANIHPDMHRQAPDLGDRAELISPHPSIGCRACLNAITNFEIRRARHVQFLRLGSAPITPKTKNR